MLDRSRYSKHRGMEALPAGHSLPSTSTSLLKSTCSSCISSLSASYLGQKPQKTSTHFLHPFVDECKKLAAGIWAFDSHENKTFKLHVYPISVHGDMMAIKYIMNFKGPNGTMLHMPYHQSPRHITDSDTILCPTYTTTQPMHWVNLL